MRDAGPVSARRWTWAIALAGLALLGAGIVAISGGEGSAQAPKRLFVPHVARDADASPTATATATTSVAASVSPGTTPPTPTATTSPSPAPSPESSLTPTQEPGVTPTEEPGVTPTPIGGEMTPMGLRGSR
jgi:hypothetical protein